ncbi:MAG: hypothetical protein P8Y37_08220 [Anaerolineales bacterium]
MKIRFLNFTVALIFLSLLLSACSPGGNQLPTDDGVDAIATSVAATLAARDAAVDPTVPQPSPTWTVHPTVTASAPEANFRYGGVSFYFNDLLAENISAGLTPGEYTEDNPWWSFPDHLVFKFNGWVLSDAFHAAAIRIYPVAEFKALNSSVDEGLQVLDAALKSEPLDVDALRVPSLFNAGQLYHSNAKALRFQNGYGARWLSLYGQGYSTIGWPNLFYTYQGFTDDGAYYVSVIFPVNHPSLLNPQEVTLDDAFWENYGTYAENTRLTLEAAPDNSFVPSLVLLDQLVSSLLVQPE